MPDHEHPPAPRLLGLVLCGGRSKRMGRDKASLPHPVGGTFLDFAIQRCRETCHAVVLGGRQPANRNLRWVEDLVPNAGPAASIASALALATRERFDAVLTTPVDTPFLRATDLQQLISPWRLDPLRLVCGSTGTEQDVEPLIAIYPVGCLAAITKLVHSKDRSLSRWIRARSFTCVTLPEVRCRNLNTPEDLHRASEVLF